MYTRPLKASHLETIMYEIDMLEYCFKRLVQDGGDHHVYLECFLLHYRNLIGFFSGKDRHGDDLSITRPQFWAAGKLSPPEIDALRKDGDRLDGLYFKSISQYVDHLTVQRHQQDREWDIRKMYDELKSILSRFKRLLKQPQLAEPPGDPILGMMADEPELVDHVVESVMKAREVHPLR